MENTIFGRLPQSKEKTILGSFVPQPEIKSKVILWFININQNITPIDPDEKHSDCIFNAQNLLTLKLA